MKLLEGTRMIKRIGALLLSLSIFGGVSQAAEYRETVAGYPAAEALRMGETMYQKGFLPSGKPMPAFVQGGIEMDGSMSTCANCHLPSGLGSLEGGIVSPPTNGAKLYAPLQGQKDVPGSTMKRSMFYSPDRPAYTDETLAKMLVTGIDPTGRKLNEIMPLYRLDKNEMAIMVYYLKNLSSVYSPGVTQDELHLATIITDDVSPADRGSMILPLQAFIDEDWNSRGKVLSAQWNALWRNTAKPSAGNVFRKIVLDVWELKGSPATWRKQLEAYYQQKPVFAILGGLTGGSWAPVHDFSEKNQIPCILPISDLPVISEEDRYTLYISKGIYQEGEAAAKFLSRVFTLPPDKKIVQVFRENERSRALVNGFTETWKKLGNTTLVDTIVPNGAKTGKEFWKELSTGYPGAVFLLWLDSADLAGVGALADSTNRPLFVSDTMLSGELTFLPDSIREFTFIAYPNRLPEERDYSLSMISNWLKYKKLTPKNINIASRVYLLKSVLTEALTNTAGEFYREYFLDNIDQSKDQIYSSLTYPLLSFGPGQRYASKGCYVVTLSKGANPKIIRQSEWVIY